MDSFEQLCRERRSIRKFTDQAVEKEKIDYMLRCALMSPAGKRLNPWEFYVLTEREKIAPLAACKTYGSGMMATATAAIVVALDSKASETWMCDGAIAAEHIMLAATEQGVGSCWCHIHEREDSERLVREAAGIPENLTVLCVIALGYKDEERKPYDTEKLMYNKIH